MSEARCTLQVRGLDCPKEVDSLTAALKDQSGVTRMGFDLIHGTMTIDYDDGLIDPQTFIRLIDERAGLQSSLQGLVEPAAISWWSRYGRWVLTAGSGAALAGGTVISWMGHRLGLEQAGADRLA
ncbi:MAG TPA: heavy-metal-associated domain-containing protein, partial [Isosphaeraceae bacterium]|nr:heavy-metal-associated domain-containing protein [Isosphaeraceae bacterium]